MMDQLRERYQAAGQAHVFEQVDELNEKETEELLEQLASIQVEKIPALLAAAEADTSTNSGIEAFSGPVGRSSDEKLVQSARSTGLQAIQAGQVAALVLAGGQGTRLGFDGPKGLYDIGLPSGSSLFQLMAERLVKLSQLAKASSPIPFYIMTSPLNHQTTVDYFAEKDYFGLGSANVFFFQQGMLPCLTPDGKIIMEAAGVVAMAPDGNGGIYLALSGSGALDDMTKRGIQYLHVFSIDNALVRPADPVFIGYCIDQKADCGNKAVWKAHAHEKVGVMASRHGRPCIVEYSEITTDMAEQTDDDGVLLFGAGNICNHFYTLEFIRQTILPNMGNLYHIAHKKIPYYDAETRSTVTPTTNNGIKLETFIFDVFPLSQSMAVLDVERAQEFAPVKNAPGSSSDSPDTARAMISELAQQWVVAAGGRLAGNLSATCEIAPSTSYAGEGLEELVGGKEIVCPFSL